MLGWELTNSIEVSFVEQVSVCFPMFYPPLLSFFRLFDILRDLKFGIRLNNFGICREAGMVSFDGEMLTFHIHNVCLLYLANSATTRRAFAGYSHCTMVSYDVFFENVRRCVFGDFIVPCSESTIFSLYRSDLAHIGSTMLGSKQLTCFGILRQELGDWL